MPEPEEGTRYWSVRLRDPNNFVQIRTPDWASLAATKMAQEWILEDASSIIPSPVSLDIDFDDLEVHARQGKKQDGSWETQSVLVPRVVLLNRRSIKVPQGIAFEIACYISSRLDRKRNPTCSRP
jgi:hypothetical protein